MIDHFANYGNKMPASPYRKVAVLQFCIDLATVVLLRSFFETNPETSELLGLYNLRMLD